MQRQLCASKRGIYPHKNKKGLPKGPMFSKAKEKKNKQHFGVLGALCKKRPTAKHFDRKANVRFFKLHLQFFILIIQVFSVTVNINLFFLST